MSYGMGSPTGSMQGNKIPKGYQQGRMQNFTPEMMQLFSSMMKHVGSDSFLSKIAGGDQSQFAQMEEPALRQFNALQGNMASRFSGMGDMGARNSSGFQNSMSAASQDFSSQLHSQRMDYQMQAIRDLLGLSSDLLNKQPYSNLLAPKQQKEKAPSFFESMMGGAAPGIGQGLVEKGLPLLLSFLGI